MILCYDFTGALISKSNADIILVFGGEADIPPLARELLRRNITSKMLIASEGWITSPFFLDPTYIQVYRGTIGFALQHGVIPGLKSYLLNFKPNADGKYLPNACIRSSNSGLSTDRVSAAQSFNRSLMTQMNFHFQIGYSYEKSKKFLEPIQCNDLITNNNSENYTLNKVFGKNFNDKEYLSFSRSQFFTNKISKTCKIRKISENDINELLLEFWETTFNCTWQTKKSLLLPCTGLERLDHANSTLTDVTQLRVTYNTYMAVYIIAHALHKMGMCVADKIIGDNNSCPSIRSFEHWQV